MKRESETLGQEETKKEEKNPTLKGAKVNEIDAY